MHMLWFYCSLLPSNIGKLKSQRAPVNSGWASHTVTAHSLLALRTSHILPSLFHYGMRSQTPTTAFYDIAIRCVSEYIQYCYCWDGTKRRNWQWALFPIPFHKRASAYG